MEYIAKSLIGFFLFSPFLVWFGCKTQNQKLLKNLYFIKPLWFLTRYF